MRTRVLRGGVRELAASIESVTGESLDEQLIIEKRAMYFNLLDKAIFRARLLQRALTFLYVGLSSFVGTSVSIGVIALTSTRFAWLALVFGFVGSGLLLLASVLVEGPAKKDASELCGRTTNNRVVNFSAPRELIGEFAEVTITGALPHSLRGIVATPVH